MFGLGKMWAYAIAAMVLMAALAGAVYGVWHAGYSARDREAIIQLAAAEQRATVETTKLKANLAATAAANDEDKRHAKMEVDSLRTQLTAGTVRLRVNVAASGDARRPAAGAAETRAESGAATADGVAAGPGLRAAELTIAIDLPKETSLELLSIAADGNTAIRDLNQCIDSYNAVKDKINGFK